METRITIGASITLFEVINKILFDTSVNPPAERDIPFNLRYKLQKSLALAQKDFLFFQTEKDKIIDEMGVEDVEMGVKRVPDDKMEEFRNKLGEILLIQVSHDFSKLKPEELDKIDITGVTSNEMNIFILSLVDDEAFMKAIQEANEVK